MTVQSFFDQLGNRISLRFPPERIVSLVPSQTELLADFGLEQKVVGITKYCVHPPEWLRTKTVIGGTKKFNFDTIDSLNPDLIIGNKEENYIEGITQLKTRYPVWMSDIVTLQDAYSMITALGKITDTSERSIQVRDQIIGSLQSIKKRPVKSVLYLIWKHPWMAAGSGTFIHSMLTMLNLKNSAENFSRYPVLSAEQIESLRPQLIFLSTEPYPFKDKHINDLKKISPSSQVMLVDGEMFSWYGSRLLNAAVYFNGLNLGE